MAEGPTPRWLRTAFLSVSAATAVIVIVLAHDVMLPFILAAVIAYVLTPLVAIVERRRVSRPMAILFVYAVVLGLIAGFLRGVTPRIAFEFRSLHDELPALAQEVREKWVPAVGERLRQFGLAQSPDADDADQPPASAFVVRPQPDGTLAVDVGSGVSINESNHGWAVEAPRDHKDEPFDPNRLLSEAVGRIFVYAQKNSLEMALKVRDLVTGISRVIFVFFITLMLAAYLMMTRERIHSFFRALFRPAARPGFDGLLRRMDRGLSGVVRGQLVICGINGVLSAVGFAVIGLKYWPVMALMAAIFSLIPIFGSIASAVPAVAVALTQGLSTAALVLVWIVGIHQLEANVLNPKIMGDSAKIHPVLVIFALLVGEHFFHVVGALLAVPAMSVTQSLFLHVRDALDAREVAVVAPSPPPEPEGRTQ